MSFPFPFSLPLKQEAGSGLCPGKSREEERFFLGQEQKRHRKSRKLSQQIASSHLLAGVLGTERSWELFSIKLKNGESFMGCLNTFGQRELA